MKTKNTAVRIKATYGYYSNAFNAPQDGYLENPPKYDGRTGKEKSTRMEFGSVKEAVAYLTGYGLDPLDSLGLEYHGESCFTRAGTYVTCHGQHSRPFYTIVDSKSGRSNNRIVAECKRIQAEESKS